MICCDDDKKQKLITLKKASSLIQRIVQMVEEDRYCIDIMQQNLAVMGMLKSFHQMTLRNHLQTCFKKGMESNSDRKKDQLINEIIEVNNLLNRQK